MYERLGDLQWLGDNLTQAVRIGAVRDDQKLTIDETVRPHRESGARQRHRKRFRSDIADFHADSLLLIASWMIGRNRMPVRRRCAMPHMELIVADFDSFAA
ncbi:hypothetical protein ABIC49_003970 [Burkholderia ambifaria]